MSGITGWVSREPVSASKRPSFASMIAGLGSLSGDHVATESKTGEIAVTAPKESTAVSTAEGVHTAIEGWYRWSNPALASTAEALGAATALRDAYRELGSELVNHLKGAFALAVWDENARRLLLAVDRLGIRPLCFAQPTPDTLVFGSTTTSVRAFPGVGHDINNQAVFDYFYFHTIPSPETIYSTIHKFEPAQALLWENGTLRRWRYWKPCFTDSREQPLDELRQELHSLLRTSVARCKPSPATGAFLSGGIDSSTVTGLLAEGQAEPARTYSIGFSAQGYDEMSYARISSKHFATQHHEYYVTPEDVADAVSAIAGAYDEPFGNSSVVPTLFCARLAYDTGTRVLLAGDGGDELFAGNERYAKQKLFELYNYVPGPVRQGLLEPLFLRFPPARWTPPTRKLCRYVEQATLPLPERTQTYNFLERSALETVFTPDFRDAVDTARPLSLLRDEYFAAQTHSSLNRMLFLDWKFTLADNDLRKVDRMCALAGVQVLFPLLDDDIVELSLRVPPAQKLKGFRLRHFVKQALADFLPPETLRKTKHGFGLPFGEWLKTSPALRDWVDARVVSLKQRGFLLPSFLDELVQDHRAGHASYYGNMIWVLAMLEEWLSQHS